MTLVRSMCTHRIRTAIDTHYNMRFVCIFRLPLARQLLTSERYVAASTISIRSAERTPGGCRTCLTTARI